MNIFLLVFLIISIYASTEEQEIPPNNLKTSLRITIITDCAPPKIGGVEILLDRLTNELEKKGHIVTLISPKDFYSIRIPYSNHHLSLTWPSTVTKLIEESKVIISVIGRNYGDDLSPLQAWKRTSGDLFLKKLNELGVQKGSWQLTSSNKTFSVTNGVASLILEYEIK